MKTFEPPSREFENYKYLGHKSIFLAGSIDIGVAENWQAKVIEHFSTKDVNILNPRRKDWDASWEQSLNSPNFYEQVSWELDMLEESDIIAMYFDPTSKSPISLLELGLYASSGKLIVCCPDGFWRKGNIDIVCTRFGIPVFTNYDTWLVEITRKFLQ